MSPGTGSGSNFRFNRDAEAGPPPPLGKIAFSGLAGRIVAAMEDHTEADPIALLLVLLVVFGSIVGRAAHFLIGGTRHACNLFLALIGPTSAGRKGTAQGAIMWFARMVDPEWYDECVSSGIASGEGIIAAVRDGPIDARPSRHRGRESIDYGVTDKRHLFCEEEFVRTLKVAQRHGSTVSPVLRSAWDGVTLRISTKHPMVATDPHISLSVHASKPEVNDHLSDIQTAGGFGNRFLWAWVRRQKYLPDGGNLSEEMLRPLADELRRSLEFARNTGEVTRTEAADEIWRDVYPRLSAERPGLYGALTARAAPQALRLAMIYALLDRLDFIMPEHLLAALEIVRYCDDSVKFIFGDRIGDPIADKILTALREAGDAGLTRSEISELFHRNRSNAEIEDGLEILREHGLATWRDEPTSGRPVQRWFAPDVPVVTR
jgi:hypothetical protein